MSLTIAYSSALSTLLNDSVAPFNNLTILIPATDIGRSPTGVSTENLPPTLSGTVNVVYPFSLASFLRSPLYSLLDDMQLMVQE